MTTIYGLAVDGNDGTECLIFNTDAERVDWIWRNCVEVWRDGEKLEGDELAAFRTECGDDWSIPMERGQWAEMCTIALTDHEMPQAPHPADAFINRMAQFTTPEEEFADPEFPHTSHYRDVEEYISDMSDDRLCGEYSTFMDMVREARTILRGVLPAADRQHIELHDWQTQEDPDFNEIGVDGRPWPTSIKTAPERIDVEATHPDGHKCAVWIEVSEGKLVIHAYDSGHEEPANIRIGKDSITYDSDRDGAGQMLSNAKL